MSGRIWPWLLLETQPAQPRGMPRRGARTSCQHRCFYPRVREGRDWPSSAVPKSQLGVSTRASARDATVGSLLPVLNRVVSTRASARDATRASLTYIFVASRFNPRVREGRDYIGDGEPCDPAKFQPARPRGTRPKPQSMPQRDHLFQPARP